MVPQPGAGKGDGCLGEREGIDPLEGGTAKQRDMAASAMGRGEGRAERSTHAGLSNHMCSSHQRSGGRFSSGRIRKSDESCFKVGVE